jgi:hypothetical protein
MTFPRPVLSRDGALTGEATGSTKSCTLSGCTGVRYFVRWPDGRYSWPCSKGIETTDDGTWRIG